MDQAVLIFSGYNQRANIAFCRTADKNNIPFFIVANGEQDTIFHTQYREKVKAIRPTALLELYLIRNIIEKLRIELNIKRFVILPNSEYLNRFFLRYRRELTKMNCIVPLVSRELYASISDKYSFGQLCEEFGLTVPEQVVEKNLPLVAKPYKYFSNLGRILKPYIILNEKDFDIWLKTESLSDFFFQRYIAGQSYYLLYYFFRNGKRDPIAFSQQNLIQQNNGKSIVAAISSQLHSKNIGKKYAEFLSSLGFFGLIMIEVKYFEGLYYMIEANPRLWGPSQLFVDSKVPLFEGFLCDNGFDVKLSEKYQSTCSRYFWSGGFIETMRKKKKLIFHDYLNKTFEKEFALFFDADIYKRHDSINLYNNELSRPN